MGSKELSGNLQKLQELLSQMGLMDHFRELRQTVMDEQHLIDVCNGRDANFRSKRPAVFVTRAWISDQIKRIARGPSPEAGLFDDLER